MSQEGPNPNPIAGNPRGDLNRPLQDGPVGLGGWLILPIIGLLVTPLRGVFHLAGYGGLLASMQRLPGSLSAFLVLEFVGNIVVLIVLPVILLVLLFRKSASFQRLFVLWAAGGLAFIVLDLIGTQVLFGDLMEATNQPLLDEQTTIELLRSVVFSVIWIPYMRLSRRVANTFTT
ncbi:MAG: DUF2569 domain-containing protein [Aquamicrobium sp.]|uniref:DUF2569 domain-containing protein n=1 Tax=Mesorhizobium sp. Pch-S TaxID=2082387 RepID=UPI00101073B0|nr:DUF2569 domain-containing protein [Mesorhizobium sp. Pch-S]MBR2691147.1 DUF2569 domain-containing protein [Aquamicrobium sp.]QAZ44508.1 hypothetical protein C1M53_17755 [Mesorhizobium sp. Pch-S]